MTRKQKWIVLGILAILVLGAWHYGYLPWKGSDIEITPTDQDLEWVYVQGVVQDPLAHSAVASATVRIKLPDSNIITATTDSNGKFQTQNMVQEGAELQVQVEASGYYTDVFTAEVPMGDWSSRDTADIGTFYIYDISGSNSMSVTDNHGNTISGSSAYNKTLYGEDFTLNVLFTVDEDDGAVGNSYTDLVTGYTYLGGLLVVKISDITKVTPEFTYDKLVTIGTTYYYIIYFDRIVNDDADSTDGSQTWALAFKALSTGTNLIDIYVYGQVRDIYIDSANFGTALASVTGIDIV